ncbi:MAG: hypothetical protein DSZ00_01230 [Gammaproteobacteria bacterium]|nr:MAG: hypothetical protein DSZ00_01230 [Gammaproteobacteria bacterium]
MSIRNRILVFAILVTLVPSLGLGWLYFSQAEKAVRESARQELATTAAHVERELQLWLKERFYEIRVFSSSYLLTGALETLHREEGSRGALANIHDYLSLIRDQYGIYTAFQLFDEGGEPILQDPADGHSWQLPANWRQQLGRQKGFTGEFSRKGENNIRLLLGVPITSREGLLQGLLAASVESSALATLFTSPVVEKGKPVSTLLLVNRQGRVLFESGPPGLSRETLPQADELFRGASELMEYPSGQRGRVLAMLKPVQGHPWGIVVEMDRKALFANLESVRNSAILLVLGMVALIGFFAWLLARGILNPLRELTQAAQRVAEGDFDVSVQVRRSDELGFATVVFNDMVMQLRQSRERLELLTTTDSLTGLLNRKGITEGFSTFLVRYRRHQRPFSVIMLDIDHFKAINDRHGHLAGDLVLKEVSRVLLEEMREVDLVGRYGGEEFLMLLDETRAETALVVAERIRNALAAAAVSHEGVLIRVTASFGVAEISSGSESMDELMERADKAMYLAKQQGRNRTVLADRPRSGAEIGGSRSA